MPTTRCRILVVFLALSGVVAPVTACAQSVMRLTPGDDVAKAIAAAKPGAILELQGGDYGALAIRRAGGQPGQPVTLRSADSGDPARISAMDLREISHMVLDGLMFDYTYSVEDKSNIRPFQIFTTRDLTIRNSVFDGDLAESDDPEEEAYPTGFGLSIRSSVGILVEGNEVRDFYRGIAVNDTTDVVVKDNDLHSIRMDGMNFAQVERALIEGNRIRDFKRAVNSADHADMIQFWTARTERPSRDIVIRDNVLNSGVGWFTQSIFMRNEEVDSGRAGPEMFYRNITIEGNVIINAHAHGITVGETDGLIIRNNSVLHNARSEGKKPGATYWTPQVNIAKNSQNVSIERNVLHRLVGYDAQPTWSVTENLEVQNRFSNQPNHYSKLFLAAQTGDPRDLSSFGYLKNGPLDKAGLGAALLASSPKLGIDGLRGVASPAIRVMPDPFESNRFGFDAVPGMSQAGLDATQAKIEWNFGDGASAQGPTVTHDFATSGSFDVTMRAILADGSIAYGSARVLAYRPEVLVLDSVAGTYTSYPGAEPAPLNISNEPGRPIALGAGNAIVTVPREAMVRFFGARSFQLDMKVRSPGNYKAAGTLLLIPKTLSINVDGRGTLSVRFNTIEASEMKLITEVLPIFSNSWINLSLRYSDKDGIFHVLADGKLVGQSRITGQLRPLEYWGLFLGFPFENGKTFDGELESLILKVGESGSRP